MLPTSHRLNPELELLKSKVLTDFPSGSSINYHDGKLYLVGDDARNILILDTDYNFVDSKLLLDYPEVRIPKPIKPDLEGSTFMSIGTSDLFVIVGSAATKKREKLFVVPFQESVLDVVHHRVFDTSALAGKLKADGVREVNIEGIAAVRDHLVLANRGNRKNPMNHLAVTGFKFWEDKDDIDVRVLPIGVPDTSDGFTGVSDMSYVESSDTLLMVLSSELTDNAYDDGKIGNSYLGWINHFAHKMEDQELKVDQLINLGKVHANLRNQKIEGICVESMNDNTLMLHLVSDDDQGHTGIFKIRMTTKP